MTKKISIFFLVFYSITCYCQERTTYRGDTSLYPTLRKRIETLSDSIRRFPHDSKLLFKRASLHYDVENWSAAEKDFTAAISIDSVNYMYYYKRGAARDRLQKANDAYQDFTKSIALNDK